MDQVFSGNINGNTTPGNGAWFSIDLPTPFLWDGSSNLVVAIAQSTNSSSYQQTEFDGYTAPGYSTNAVYSSGFSSIDPMNPPTPDGSSTILAQVKFDLAAAPPCSGTPSAGNLPGNKSVCSGVNFTVNASGYTSGFTGLSGKWQISNDGSSWSDISPAVTTSSLTTNFSGITGDKKYYRYALTCNSGGTAYSNTLTAQILCYCIPSASGATYWINSFSTSGGVNNISNLSTGFSQGGYGDFTGQKVVVEEGGSVSFTIGNYGALGNKLWIDWNNDGDFDDTDEEVFKTTSATSSSTATITVPSGVGEGIYRMRVGAERFKNAGPATACADITRGEFEDYSFEVFTPVPDLGLSTIASPADSFCTGNLPLKVNMVNYGTVDITSATINWKLDGVLQTPYSYTGNLLVGTSDEITLDMVYFPLNTDVAIEVWTSLPNGVQDPNAANDSIALTSLKATNDVPYATGIQISTIDSINYSLELTGALRGDTYTWDFGDGSAPTTFTVDQAWSYHYNVPGSYTVSVKISNDCGDTTLYSQPLLSLPVKMSALTARLNQNNQAELEWTTFKEVNNKGFHIQQSKNGKEFNQIEFVKTLAQEGNSDGKIKYHFVDRNPVTGSVFYRLVQEDIDSKQYVSNIVKINASSLLGLILEAFPNPVENTISLNIKGQRTANATVRIIDALGKTLKVVEINQANTNINLQGFASGIYIIKYQDDVNTEFIKVFKK